MESSGKNRGQSGNSDIKINRQLNAEEGYGSGNKYGNSEK